MVAYEHGYKQVVAMLQTIPTFPVGEALTPLVLLFWQKSLL